MSVQPLDKCDSSPGFTCLIERPRRTTCNHTDRAMAVVLRWSRGQGNLFIGCQALWSHKPDTSPRCAVGAVRGRAVMVRWFCMGAGPRSRRITDHLCSNASSAQATLGCAWCGNYTGTHHALAGYTAYVVSGGNLAPKPALTPANLGLRRTLVQGPSRLRRVATGISLLRRYIHNE